MKPTAYVLFFLSLVMAVSAALVFRTPDRYAPGNQAVQEGTWTPSAIVIILLVSAVAAAALGWVMLRFGGKGYTVTNSPSTRR